MTAVDWFRIIVSLERAGIPDTEQAKLVGVPRSTLRGWKDGSEPKHSRGEALLELYESTVECANGGKPPAT